MNVITYEEHIPDRSFPWFDEWQQHNTFCKVYNDGGCYIAVPSSTMPKKHKGRNYMRSSMDDIFDQLYLKAIKENVAKKDLQEYIPEGQMVGEIYERRDYSTRHHNMQITHPNTFFEDKLGRNDFEFLSDAELRRGTTMQYLLKYLEKTEERIIYSRGIPTEFSKIINDNDVICELVDFVTKFVLFNDVIDYSEDVKRDKKRPRTIFSSPLPS